MKKIIFLLSIFIFANTYSQSNPEKELGVWYMYNGSHKVAPKFSVKSMAHFRFFEIGDDLQQFIGRLGANYTFNKHFNVTLGYAFLNTDTSYDIDGGDFNEHRVYEDLNIKHNISKLTAAHRLRAEQRFFNAQTGHFLRYQLALGYPLSSKWSTYIYDEVFLDFEGEAFNQNWLGVGVKYKLSDQIKLQLGYMNIALDNAMNFDRIQIGIAINTDHLKKK